MISIRPLRVLSALGFAACFAGCAGQSQVASSTPSLGQASLFHRAGAARPNNAPACPNGNPASLVFVGDQSANLIQAYKPAFPAGGVAFCTVANPTGSFAPWGVAVDQSNNLYAGYG